MKELINLQLMMFALIITGLILKKVGVVGKEAQKGMTNLVIDLILPCNIIYSFMIKFSSKIAQDFVVILVISILIQVFCVILGGVLYNKCSVKRKKCLRYATICSNAGFLGNPIAQGVFGMMGLTSGKHEDDTNLTGNDTWMGKDFLEHFLFGWCFGEYGNAL